MRWSDLGRSRNLEDRRGDTGGGGFGGGFGRLGLGGIAIVVVIALLTKQNPLALLQQVQGGAEVTSEVAAPVNDPAEEKEVHFVSFVLDTAEAFWASALPAAGTAWRPVQLVLFRDATGTGCGEGQTASGPFYCPSDEKIYIDLGFYAELKSRFGAPGDFAQAYVLAHELGHHVQKLLGTEAEIRRAQQQHPDMVNRLSISLELQADCYAGIWGHAAAKQGIVEAGDLEQGIAAAAAVGDDRLQRMGGGTVHPESWTHGSSAQRTEWFQRGFSSGDMAACAIN